MGRKTWTTEQVELLKRRYPTAPSVAALAAQFGFSIKTVYAEAQKLGLHRPRQFNLWKYTEEQFEFVQKNYPHISNKTLSVLSGVELPAIMRWRSRFQWHKSGRYRAECRQYGMEQKNKMNKKNKPI